MEQFVNSLCLAGKVQIAKHGFQSGGLGIVGVGSTLGHGVDMGIFAPAIVGKFGLSQMG